jgi:hypothetical protein
MARPKLDDPTVPIAFRMKRSAAEWWTAIAADRDSTLPKVLREFGERVAAFPGGGTQLLDGLERGFLGSTSPPSTHTSDGSPESTELAAESS